MAPAQIPAVRTPCVCTQARLFRIEGGTYASFSRTDYSAFREPRGQKLREWGARHSNGLLWEAARTTMHLVQLAPPPQREVPLRFAGRAPVEKNWMPLVWRDPDAGSELLFFVYSFCRAGFRVLRCNPTEGTCHLAHSLPPPSICTPTPGFCRPPTRSCHDYVKGGSQLIRVVWSDWPRSTADQSAAKHAVRSHEGYLGVVHRSRFSSYQHAFVALEPQPPFRVVASTDWFALPHLNDSWTDPQFCAGLALDNHRNLLLSYGVADCEALRVALTLSDVEKHLIWVS